MVMKPILATAWTSLVLVVAWRNRPVPTRARSLLLSSPSYEARQWSTPRASLIFGPIDALGRTVLRLLKRYEESNENRPFIQRRAGIATLVVVVSLPVLPPLSAGIALMGVLIPILRRRSAQRQRIASYLRHLPEVVDLYCLATGAGLNVSLAVEAVADRAPSPFAEEFIRVTRECAVGRRLADALEDVVTRTDEVVRPLITSLVAAERYGAPLGDSLIRLADEVRAQRRRRAEEAARRVPVKLLFPLVLCILPAFGLLTMAPVLVSAFKALHL